MVSAAGCHLLLQPATMHASPTCPELIRQAPSRLRGHRHHQRRHAGGGGSAQAAADPTSGSGGTVLFLSPVWPERTSSAAGVRTSDLLEAFCRRGWRAAYASSSTPNEHTAALQAAGVAAFQCQPNRESQLADILAAVQPTAVVFDRFYSEEAYSFRTRELAPGAMRLLDMQDFHALRGGRQRLAEAGAAMEAVQACRPDAVAPDCLRELAAIHRCVCLPMLMHVCLVVGSLHTAPHRGKLALTVFMFGPHCSRLRRSDLVLVCSPVELQLLIGHYGVPASKVVLAPFFAPPSPHTSVAGAAGPDQACPSHAERKHFLMIGNWRHPPNLDSARWACSEIWPALRAALPSEHRDAQLHMYGSYAAGAAQQLHRPVSASVCCVCGVLCACIACIAAPKVLNAAAAAAEGGRPHEGVCPQPGHHAQVPCTAGATTVRSRAQGQGGWHPRCARSGIFAAWWCRAGSPPA